MKTIWYVRTNNSVIVGESGEETPPTILHRPRMVYSGEQPGSVLLGVPLGGPEFLIINPDQIDTYHKIEDQNFRNFYLEEVSGLKMAH